MLNIKLFSKQAIITIIFYNRNLISIECNYQIYNKKLFVIIRYLKH